MPTSTTSHSESLSFAEAFELINPHLYTVEERIRAQAKSFDPAVEGYVSYICGAGGKRLRPALALLSAGATGKITPGHVDLAVILELIHIATLVHDDIIDGAELRRDQPSANAKWGNSISVLLGDVLFAHALKLSTNFSNSDICRRIADAASEVCSGEIIQTQRRFDLKLTTADYYRIIEMKTAALFTAACELGAFISEASPAVIGCFKTFGTKLGVAYQIYDDILDFAGNEEETGKTLGTDLQKGKFTLPVLLMLQSGKDVSALRDMLLNDEPGSTAALAAILQEAGTIENAKAIANRLIAEAVEQLDGVQDNRYARGLRAIPEHLHGLLKGL
jgi:octaprenyl-diphosphate synthase